MDEEEKLMPPTMGGADAAQQRFNG
jgi:hypothetical protein